MIYGLNVQKPNIKGTQELEQDFGLSVPEKWKDLGVAFMRIRDDCFPPSLNSLSISESLFTWVLTNRVRVFHPFGIHFCHVWDKNGHTIFSIWELSIQYFTRFVPT